MSWHNESIDDLSEVIAKREAEIAELRRQLEQERDLTEWMKHALSEQAWHFRATLEALQLQYKHDQKREFKDVPVEAAEQNAKQASWCPEVGRNPYAIGQTT